ALPVDEAVAANRPVHKLIMRLLIMRPPAPATTRTARRLTMRRAPRAARRPMTTSPRPSRPALWRRGPPCRRSTPRSGGRRASRELRRVVGGEGGLRLPDASHQAEHVLACLRRARVLLLPGGHLAHEVVIDALDDAGPPVRQCRLVSRHQPASELALCRADR